MKKNYSTVEIIEMVHNAIFNIDGFSTEYQDYTLWEERYHQVEKQVMAQLPEITHHNFPLNVDVTKLIYKSIYKITPFSKNYVIRHYEKDLNGLNYLLYPSNNSPSRLLIFFSGLSGRKTYNRYSWYWDETEKWQQDTVYLFLNDLEESWYMGNEHTPLQDKYVKIINSVLAEYNITRDRTYTIGGSMGGYTAIFFAVDMELKGAISIHPQVTYQSTRKHRVNDWETKILQCGSKFYDLTDYLFKRRKVPFIYLEYGEYEADKEGAEKLIRALQKREAFVVFRKTANPDHVTENPSKQTVESILNLFENTGFDDEYIR
jgi:pimeloyl-ACP methyl ester carboxylesterase